MAALERRAEMDLAFRLKIGDLREQVPPFVLTRMKGGSGFPISQTLRSFFLEYFDRLMRYARAHADAGSQSGRLDPFEPVVLSILLEQQKQIERLKSLLEGER